MLASRVRATELDPSGYTVVLSVLCRSRPPRYKRVTRTSVEESPSQLGRSDNRPLLAIKVALVGVIVVTLSAAGWRGVTQSDTRTEVASGPEPVLTSLASVTSPAVLGELPEATSQALVGGPVAQALVLRAEKLAREAEEKRLAEEKKRAIEAAILPERGIWNGTAPLPGSEVHDLMTMPMLQAEQAPVVALTFDDGPSKYTAEILAILKKEQVPATFFFLGMNVQERPADARMVADAGFPIGSHTMDHKDLKTLTPAAAEAQLANSTKVIDDLLGAGTVQCARAPYGSFNDDTLRAAKKQGLGLVGWDVDTEDWKVRDSGRILARATVPGKRQLILAHDGGGERRATVEALPAIIAHYKAQGARFVELCTGKAPGKS
jgi:peptidoglycan/xylan/chitin deacetylase (PgdA/CDA1 family)